MPAPPQGGTLILIFRLATAIVVAVVLLAGTRPAQAEPPEIHVVDVQPGDGIEIVFVGAPVGASSWWWPPTPEEYVQDAMADIVAFYEQHSGVTAAPTVVVFRDIHLG